MELVYLVNGQACYLKEKIGNKFIVNKIFEYEESYGEEREMIEYIDENNIVVDTILHNPPIEKFSDEVSQLLKQKNDIINDIKSLGNERLKIEHEIKNLAKTKITNDSFIIDKSELVNANRLVMFAKDIIMPITVERKEPFTKYTELKAVIQISLKSNGEKSWGYKIEYDNDEREYSNSYNIDPEYGILIDPTDGEVEEIIKKRIIKGGFYPREIAKTDDKYLTPEALNIKKSYLEKEIEYEKNRLEKSITECKKRLEDMEGKLTKVVSEEFSIKN